MSATAERSYTLLVVEDKTDYAELVVRRLGSHRGFRAQRVSSLEGATRHMGHNEVDCLILDLSLPDAHGLQALRVLRRIAPATAIIVLTGNPDEALPGTALAAGAEDYLLKAETDTAGLQRAVMYAIERKRQGNEIAAQATVARAILDALSSPTVLLDPGGRIVAVNAAWNDLQRDENRDVGMGADYLELCRRPPADLPPAEAAAPGLAAVLAGGSEMFELDYACGENDERRWYALCITPCPGPAMGAVVTHVPITRLKLVEEELAHLALHDHLTGLPNRRLFFDRLGQALSRAERAAAPLGVIYVDIDHFKSINDTYGHAVGDAVLAHVGGCLGDAVRSVDTVAHLAGDEFAVLIEGGTASQTALTEFTTRFTSALCEPFSVGGRTLRVSASLGVAVSVPGEPAAGLLARADQALYSAKRQGRDRIVWDGANAGDATVARDLPAAVLGGALRLHQQPIVWIPDGHAAGHELLVRWQHPDRGLLLPDQFIPEAERSGTIIELGRWVLRRACERLYPGADGFLSMNVSATQLEDPALLAVIRRAHEDGIDVTRLCLEITESAVIADLSLAHSLLAEIRAFGVKIAIDDFGAGQTSLRYLHDLPVDILKVDRTLISRLGHDDRATLIVTAIVELGRALGFSVVGEGVETAAQAHALALLGCPLGQGFYWSEPQP
jgi:diguanylate cyclase (GGDEF)-like protein